MAVENRRERVQGEKEKQGGAEVGKEVWPPDSVCQLI